MKDIQMISFQILTYPDDIQFYPYLSNMDIFMRYLSCHPIHLSYNILVILVLYPLKYP